MAGVGGGAVVQGLLYTGLEAAIQNSKLGFIFDVGNAIFDAIEMDRLMSLYPQNWTLFSFGPIYMALDFMEAFISSDEKCLTYRAQNSTEIISCDFPDLTSAAALDGAMLVATRCWADAQRSVGSSSGVGYVLFVLGRP